MTTGDKLNLDPQSPDKSDSFCALGCQNAANCFFRDIVGDFHEKAHEQRTLNELEPYAGYNETQKAQITAVATLGRALVGICGMVKAGYTIGMAEQEFKKDSPQ